MCWMLNFFNILINKLHVNAPKTKQKKRWGKYGYGVFIDNLFLSVQISILFMQAG